AGEQGQLGRHLYRTGQPSSGRPRQLRSLQGGIMNGTLHAITMGAKRGWHEQVLSLRSSQDQAFYLFWALVTLAYMYFNRDTVIEGIGLTIPQVALPTIFATAVGVALVIGPAQQ